MFGLRETKANKIECNLFGTEIWFFLHYFIAVDLFMKKRLLLISSKTQIIHFLIKYKLQFFKFANNFMLYTITFWNCFTGRSLFWCPPSKINSILFHWFRLQQFLRVCFVAFYFSFVAIDMTRHDNLRWRTMFIY